MTAAVLGVGLWVVQLAVGLPHWLWVARLVSFAVAAAGFVLTWAAVIILSRSSQAQGDGSAPAFTNDP
jgi:hypothetical protein